MLAVLMITLGICLLLSVPIAISIVISSIVGFVMFYPDTPFLSMVAQAMVSSVDSFPMMAIPLFMLVGTLMGNGGIAKKLVNVAEVMTGNMAGGLGMAAILAAMFFAAISGSGPAVVAAIGAILIPTMTTKKYDPAYSGALIASSSTIGIVIPPSIPIIIFGVTAGVSVTKLFTAGFIPGIIMGVSLMIVNYVISKKRGYVGERRKDGIKDLVKAVKEGIWALLLPFIILGGIYAGIFTPTESAAVGVVYSVIISTFVYKEMTLQKYKDSVIEAALLSAVVLILLGGATTFGRLLALERIPEQIALQISQMFTSPIQVLLIINLFLLVTGMLMDAASNIILLAPIFVPIVVQLGYDPVYFGVLMVVNLGIGLLTPPLGMNLFVAQSVSKATFEQVVRQTVPFLVALLLVLLLFIVFPEIILFLPNLLNM